MTQTVQIIAISESMHWAFGDFRVEISNNKEIIIITYARIQYFTNFLYKFIYQGFVRIATTAH